MSENREICSIGKIIISSTLKRLHSIENINVYVEINHFKLSRFNDNETGQQIRRIGIKGTCGKKNIYFLTNSKTFSLQKKLKRSVRIGSESILKCSSKYFD